MFDALTNEAAEARLKSNALPTKDSFEAALKKGWQTLEWNRGHFFLDGNGIDQYSADGDTVSACAIGAAAFGFGMSWRSLLDKIPYHVANRIIDASNHAGSKEAAIKAVAAVKW